MGVVRLGLIWGILGFGFYHIFTTQYYTNCKMTWMYEKPQYAHIDVPEIQSDYKLYFYGEGNYYKDVTREDSTKWRFKNSHPVLYIPGSGGSYRQSRSIGKGFLNDPV